MRYDGSVLGTRKKQGIDTNIAGAALFNIHVLQVASTSAYAGHPAE